MFNNKKVAQLEKTVAGLQDDLKYRQESYKALSERNSLLADYAEDVKALAARDKEILEYKLLLVEALMKQLTININMNGKEKK